MVAPENLCLSLAIDQLKASGTNHYAVWVINAPYPGGYVHHDCIWSHELNQLWQAWQEMFALRGLPPVPSVAAATSPLPLPSLEVEQTGGSKTSRLMQHLGISLWQWLFDGAIQSSLNQSAGIAMGQSKPLRLRLEIRDPNLVGLPWEIMQPQAGKQAISLSEQLLFSRTTSDVDPLPSQLANQFLRILLVLGEDTDSGVKAETSRLKLEKEADILAQVMRTSSQMLDVDSVVTARTPCHVDTLVQPTPAELIACLERGDYNVMFYAGHGKPAPNGGLLLLCPDVAMSGTELAQVLTRCRVTLAVFNACWSAQPDQDGQQAIPRSSLAEVLIHHGVPAVLGMRDSIADHEALSFIQKLSQKLAERLSIDQAVAIARQHLLTLYKFNQPAWTLPVLYMHPEFNGELLKPLEEGKTELPRNSPTQVRRKLPTAYLRLLESQDKVWPIQGGMMRVGRKLENDLVIQEQWVSQKHAEIFYRDVQADSETNSCYFLRDFSRYGTLMLNGDDWQKIHHQEIPLRSGTRLKFGSSQGQTLEFLVDVPVNPDA
ncbi:MAG: CHAT domain-containing protein [Cyanobacteria bacterium]|nr:CHAT domain-containing protein [Cyanobacteriota bacterium]MDW8201037.1 CHAT domain-containing protein [Cyanobacteriota bacterium SKYGB_h_bin112]